MEDVDITKLVATGVLAAGVGGFGGHTIGSGDEETVVNNTTVQACSAFIQHAERHAREECEIEKLKLTVK